jgi:hypothetical protein
MPKFDLIPLRKYSGLQNYIMESLNHLFQRCL